MDKVRIGVLGGARGSSLLNYCKVSDKAQLVAVCDYNPEVLDWLRKDLAGEEVAFYASFDDFVNHDMDAVILANYANEHVPFAIRCMEKGLHVYSEVLPCATMKEAVELIEAVERTGKIYAYGENYCYMDATTEMKKLYREGKIGEIEYAEGEYVHNCESIWPSITYGERNHWRNQMHAFFYCTHSFGPIIHITGLKPKSVVGFEGPFNERQYREGAPSGSFGVEMVTLENGAIVKSLHGYLYRDSIWYSIYGAKGRMESAREDADAGAYDFLYVNADEYSGQYGERKVDAYAPARGNEEVTKRFGHGGSDYYCVDEFVKKVMGDEEADTIDVYEAMDMYLPGIFAFQSALKGGISVEVPDLRKKEVREQYRNDTSCTFPDIAGDQLLPQSSHGTMEIPDEVYDVIRAKWEARKK